ncbi:MAG: hypothetical protein Q7J35_18045 [Candidatus Methanoperedens sp.]|nr:hypothetical protein [Candidatus Methanoperedens sp.]
MIRPSTKAWMRGCIKYIIYEYEFNCVNRQMLQKIKVYKFRKIKAEIDAGLNKEHLNDLNRNERIELSSVCAGHSKKNPAHIIFQYKGKGNIKKELSKIPNTKLERDVWRG